MMSGSIWNICLYFIALAFILAVGPIAWLLARISTGRRIPISYAFRDWWLSAIAATIGFWGAELVKLLVDSI
jgi:hypothetical protein